MTSRCVKKWVIIRKLMRRSSKGITTTVTDLHLEWLVHLIIMLEWSVCKTHKSLILVTLMNKDLSFITLEAEITVRKTGTCISLMSNIHHNLYIPAWKNKYKLLKINGISKNSVRVNKITKVMIHTSRDRRLTLSTLKITISQMREVQMFRIIFINKKTTRTEDISF